MKKISVTIGIPVHNEEANIEKLLVSLLAQKTSEFRLKEIIIVSDGSSDDTVNLVRSVKDLRIHLIDYPQRKGLNAVQNEIISKATGDILVLINGDVLPKDANFIRNMIDPIVRRKDTKLVSAKAEAVPGKTFLSKVLANGHELREYLFNKVNYGANLYLCHGQARAFSRKLYSKIVWPDNCPEDSYSYLYCLKQGYNFEYSKDAVVLFSAARTISDQAKQSNRFIDGQKVLEEIFDRNFVQKHFRIPLTLIIFFVSFYTIRRPLTTVSYISVLMFIRLFIKTETKHHSLYEISYSTKKL